MVCASHALPQEACYSETYQVFKERHLVPFQALEGLLQLPWRLTGAGLSCVTRHSVASGRGAGAKGHLSSVSLKSRWL